MTNQKEQIVITLPRLKKGQKCWFCKKAIIKNWCWNGHWWHNKCKNKDSNKKIRKYLRNLNFPNNDQK